MKYKGFTIEKAYDAFDGKFYIISKDNEQYYPTDGEYVFTIAQCKNAINTILSSK